MDSSLRSSPLRGAFGVVSPTASARLEPSRLFEGSIPSICDANNEEGPVKGPSSLFVAEREGFEPSIRY